MQEGRKVFKDVVPMVSELILSHLADNGIQPASLKRIWLHQANQGMNDMIAKRVLGREPLSGEAPNILDEYANTSSAGSVIAFHKYNEDLNAGDLGAPVLLRCRLFRGQCDPEEIRAGVAAKSSEDAMQKDAAAARKDTAFIGHPVGLAWLSASEFWERFSYYGMQSLLVLYGSHYLLQPGHVEKVLGFQVLRGIVEWVYGANLSPQALAIGISGLYSASVYLTPIGGGLLADRGIGRTRTVILGATLMTIGQFMLAFDAGFAIGLLCLLLGVGCFKGNIASQVGDLYSAGDLRRADAFQIYFLGIQLAVIIAPIICGGLSQKVEWHLGFIASGVGMVFGLMIYLFGRKTFPAEPLRKRAGEAQRPPLTDRDWKVVALLVGLLPVLALSIVSNQGDLQRLSHLGGEELPDRLLRRNDADFLDAVGGRDREHRPHDRRHRVLALVEQALDGAERDHQDRHRHRDQRLRAAGAGGRVGARCGNRPPGIDDVGGRLPRRQRSGIRERSPGGLALYSRARRRGWAAS